MTPQRKTFTLACWLLLAGFSTIQGQSMLDLSLGTSNQDRVSFGVAFRRQFSPTFRAGIEWQYGAVDYRFIDAKPITSGYSSAISLPMSWRLYDRDKLRLDVYLRGGLRFQGIIDPDDNDIRDSILSSTALLIDPGLIVSLNPTARWSIQSGFTLPILYQIQPSALFENSATNILVGTSYALGDNRIFFFKSLFGPAAGGDGDTQKFVWSAQAGFRFQLGKSSGAAPLFLEPSF